MNFNRDQSSIFGFQLCVSKLFNSHTPTMYTTSDGREKKPQCFMITIFFGYGLTARNTRESLQNKTHKNLNKINKKNLVQIILNDRSI